MDPQPNVVSVHRKQCDVAVSSGRLPRAAYHEAGHVVGAIWLGYRVKYAMVPTSAEIRERLNHHAAGKDCVLSGSVETEDILPPNLRREHFQPGPALDAIREIAMHEAVIALTGPMAEARYRKRALTACLQSDATSIGDSDIVNRIGTEWFDNLVDFWSDALTAAGQIVRNPDRWTAIEAVARTLLRCGRMEWSSTGEALPTEHAQAAHLIS